MQKSKLLLFLILFLTAKLSAQQLFKAPDDFLPHRLGEQFTAHHQLINYFEYAAAQKPAQCKIVPLGTTNEERQQLAMIISSSENMSRLEEIRLNNLRRVGLEAGSPDNNNPIAIVYMGYSVHGNEAAGSESSMRVLYELLNENNKNTQNWLKNTVVIIDPSQNPDGYSRYTHWYRDVCNMLPAVDKSTYEHLEPWPTGRVNHYLFDLNRDWAWATQTESQNRIRFYKQWMPHVHPDIHEQGSDAPYYFAPAAEPFHKYITPFQRQFQTEIGKNHAKYFDENGWLYFTREVFDLFYPSYGDTYPTFNGAIGMTYEQGGIGAGRAVLTEIGDTLTLYDRINHHFTTSISTVEMASKNAVRLVDNFTRYFKETSSNPQGEYKTYVIKAENGTQKLKKLTTLLDLHKIQYGSVAAQGALGFDYSDGKEKNFSISPKDLVISAYQPSATFTQVLFDPLATLSDSITYDITAWALPYAQGLQSFATKQKINVDKKFQLAESQFINKPNAYAYLVDWKSVHNARFLSHLLQNDVRVRFSAVPFEVEGKKYDYGTLIITRADNKRLGANFDNVVKNVAQADNQPVTAVATGFVDNGADFGSSRVRAMSAPRVLLLNGDGVANNAFGHLWYFFEKDLDYPASIIPAEKLKRTDLSKYDVLVITDGSYDFDEKTLEKVRSWVQAGGKLIAIEEALRALEDQKGFNLKKPTDAANTENRRLDSFVDMERKGISDIVPGAIFKLKMDNTHPLAYGFNKTYYALKTNTLHYDQNKDIKDVGYLEKDFEVIGFAGHKAKQLLKNSSQIAVQNAGKGQIIYLADSPVFRGFWDQGKLLLSNAIFMVGK